MTAPNRTICQREAESPSHRLSPETTECSATGGIETALAFWESLGCPVDIDELAEHHLFTWLAGLLKAGRDISALRRALEALRPVVERGHPVLSAQTLHRIDGAVLAVTTHTTALVVSADPIVRSGLAATLTEQGVMTWPKRLDDAVPQAAVAWSYVFVWLPSPRGIDPNSSVGWIAEAAPTGVPVIAVHPSSITELFRLRLAEAGTRYVLSQRWLAEHAGELAHMLSNAELPEQFHLETPLALRQRLGLRLSGQLAPLLEAAAELDADVWRTAPDEPAPTVARSDIKRLRTIACEEAGIPPPFGRYSTAMRNAPKTPDWRDVQRVVRQSLNLAE
ncbi:hypothetical protein [Nocardia higoensis]|uniref:hypothetical protein n=1 Tax=Nocardia higoensis TaxID=228599 RepID=UPI0005936CCB|nr:hypothetical protein [Nocardia higoensis]